ncbi:sulfite exporter TauE/SafE family protein [Amycolatopsis rubida]|uniref:Probable membrane transporter protein n=1 Tax=Amycolatopsis rubida TaxID=112413 RepID=A0ABX0BRP4_9PSEU|nr:sulfite exporter TauE/SafE family protein [Amycolatopsis sp. M39]MYW93049.1 TSUP family transporter [Amycolatopsis rubida]NEC58036.1 sulfite exporter TauE/SafE family protein [Amycolatopsis rubida]OAP20963.1 Sulfite exporter TauE/SafE [Amycolatopsis sp. M39]
MILGALAIAFAGFIGGLTGFGASLVGTPLLLLIGFPLPQVVVINLIATMITRLAVLHRERAHIAWRRVAVLGAASLPGAAAGALTLHLLPPSALRILAGTVVVLSGLRLLLRPAREARPATTVKQTIAGLLGGYLSTTTSLNGAPPAVLLASAKVPPRTFVGDLAGYFVVTNCLSLLLLVTAGQFDGAGLGARLPILVLAALAGNLLGGRLIGRIPRTVFDRAIVALIVTSGVVTIISA